MIKHVTKLVALLTFASSPALSGTLSEDHPDVLFCAVKSTSTLPDSDVLLYLSAIGEDGSVMYQSMGPVAMTAIYDAKGNLTGPFENVCDGNSLSELEAQGRARSY